jgi:hypothetical protein
MVLLKKIFYSVKDKILITFSVWINLPLGLRISFKAFFISFIMLVLLEKSNHFILDPLYKLFGIDCFISKPADYVTIKLVLGFLLAFISYYFRSKRLEKRKQFTSDLIYLFQAELNTLLTFKNKFYKLITISLLITITLNNILLILSLGSYYIHLKLVFLIIVLFIIFTINVFRISRHEVDLLFDEIYETNYTNYKNVNHNSHILMYIKKLFI